MDLHVDGLPPFRFSMAAEQPMTNLKSGSMTNVNRITMQHCSSFLWKGARVDFKYCRVVKDINNPNCEDQHTIEVELEVKDKRCFETVCSLVSDICLLLKT